MERINDREADEAASLRALLAAAGASMEGAATAVVPTGTAAASSTLSVERVVTTLTTAGLQLAVTIFILSIST
jgi:hypothetical protein